MLIAATAPIHGQSGRPFDAAAWQEDVRVIARELPARHPDLFFRMTRAQWDSAVATTERKLPTLTRNQALVALMQLVAFAQDGHTTINPLFDRAAAVRYYPIELYQFDDGLFIRSAAPDHAALAGARVLEIGRATTEQALDAVASLISHENEWWIRQWGPVWLTFAEILDGLGLLADPERLPLVIERGGRRETISLAPIGRIEPAGHNPHAGIDRSNWVGMRGSGDAPLWLRNQGRPYWVHYEPGSQTLYVSYRAVTTMPPPNDNASFWRDVFARADSLPLARLVLDIRENTGGNSFFNRQVVRGIIARPEIDRPDRLFVIIGGRTFSAAMNLARDLEKWTNATFVGEPTGNAAYFFGDHVQVPLPGSGLTVNVSTLTWPPYDPRDRRAFLAPALYTPLVSSDYRANVDPALRAILARASEPSLAERVEAAVVRGDSASGVRLVESARAAPVNRYRSPEAEINALGYRLLNAGQRTPAIAVFGINTVVFPLSANVWDSLGEALVIDGQREAGIAAYRRALTIDPDYRPSVEALRRLGVR